MKLIAAVAGFVALGQVGANVQAQTTQVNVRVVSHDADRAIFGMSEKRRVGSLPKIRQFPAGAPKVCAPSPRDRSDACTLLSVRSQSP